MSKTADSWTLCCLVDPARGSRASRHRSTPTATGCKASFIMPVLGGSYSVMAVFFLTLVWVKALKSHANGTIWAWCKTVGFFLSFCELRSVSLMVLISPESCVPNTIDCFAVAALGLWSIVIRFFLYIWKVLGDRWKWCFMSLSLTCSKYGHCILWQCMVLIRYLFVS